MPRKKTTAPARLTEEEQQSSTWRMGEQPQANDSSPNNLETVEPREYSVVFDDDEDEDYATPEDDDYAPPVHKKRVSKQLTPRKKKEKVVPKVKEKDHVLESLLETSTFFAEVREKLVGQDGFESSVSKLDIFIDLDRTGLTETELPSLPNQNQFWIYLSDIPGRSFIYYEWLDQGCEESDKQFEQRKRKGTDPDNIKYFYIKDIQDRRILNAFSVKQKVLKLKLHRIYELLGRLEIKVCVTEDSLVKLSHPSDSLLRVPSEVRQALQFCFTTETFKYFGEKNLNHDIDQLYRVVKQHHDQEKEERAKRVQVDPQHRSLLPRLRDYQADAVRWMLEKENYARNLDDDLQDEFEDLHPLYTEVKTHDGTVLYFNKFGGYLVREKPLARESLPGGILADEMGLGKTVEVLACMLNNPRRQVEQPNYLEPILIASKKKRRKARCRSPSPIEFHLKENPDVSRLNSDILKPSVERSETENIDEDSTLGEDTESSVPHAVGEDTELSVPHAVGEDTELSVPHAVEEDSILSVPHAVGEDTEASVPHAVGVDAELSLPYAVGKKAETSIMCARGGYSGSSIPQIDGGDTSSSSEEFVDDANDSDFVPESHAKTRRPDKSERSARKSLSRKFSERRTVYYHEEFDSQSSDNDDVPLTSRKKRSVSRKKSKDKEPPKKKAKTINTSVPVSDTLYPVFEPFKNGEIPEKGSKNIHDLLVKSLVDLREDRKNRNGVSVTQLKNHMKSIYDKDVTQKNMKEKFVQSINHGVETGQFIRTSLGSGATGSIALNPHYDPDDTRSVVGSNNQSISSEIIDQVITQVCYDRVPYSKPHIPSRFASVIKEKEAAREANKTSHKGELYDKLKVMYDMSMPMSLASYATDKRSKEWRKSFFSEKVEPRSYFECICGGTEESEGKPGYRVQCKDCGTEQHADCMKYNLGDPYRGDYVCPHCWVQAGKVPSGATLIVSPSAISFQWIEEIQKHVKHKDIRMFYYKGSKEMGYIQPRTLANYDIVITSYETLAQETNYVDLPHSNSSEGRRFRNPKRFMAMPSPITCIDWWRICLDEAQMIESTTTKTAEMAKRLSGVNKWCVTGTPIGKSINDLQGLLAFLRIDPYMLDVWWKLCIYDPFCYGIQAPMEDLLCKILWRTCKKDVLEQIDLQGQREEVHWLQFSPVEEHFYRRQHIDITRDIIGRLTRFDGSLKLSTLDRGNLSYLLQPLLRLRQSCCHPQAVRGQFMALQKTTMTMEQLLEQLIKKATLETEESHRQYVAALNGLAGVDIIQEKFVDAVENYREVLRSASEHEGRIKTDTLQRLHTVSNLAELLEANHADIQPTLRDSELRDMMKALKERYMKKYLVGVEGAKTALKPVEQLVHEGYSTQSKRDAWYQKVVNWVDSAQQENILMKQVHDELAQFFDIADEKEFREIQAKYPNTRIVMYKMSEKLDEIDKMRRLMKKSMKELVDNDPETFLNRAVDCHLRISSLGKKNKSVCKLCEVRDSIDLYENILFRFVKGEIKGGKGPNRASVTAEERKQLEESGVILLDELRRGTWSDSEGERICRAVYKFAKNRMQNIDASVLDEASNQMKLLENIKKEFRLTRILLGQIFDQVAGVDELNMSRLRLRLRYDDEPFTPEGSLKKKKEGTDFATRVKEKVETIYILEKHELDSQRLKLVAEKVTSKNEMKRKLGQLLYLKNLQGSEYGKKGGHNPEPCPICQKDLGTQWSVLQCGHCYCVECIRLLLDEYSTGRGTKCAVCRSMTARAEISYVSTKNDDEADNLDLEDVKGSHSTKIEAVVRALVRIRSEDEHAKALVFSTWPDVLDILGAALDENDIPYAALHSTNSSKQSEFKRNIQKFKNREDVKVLLLPVSRGANGLNLVEANHVLLVEPILNPAQELQAIGRIHRIGQKKSTVVHRFLVRTTIEERIHQMLKHYYSQQQNLDTGGHSTEENLLTIQDLRLLFNDDFDPNLEQNDESVTLLTSAESVTTPTSAESVTTPISSESVTTPLSAISDHDPVLTTSFSDDIPSSSTISTTPICTKPKTKSESELPVDASAGDSLSHIVQEENAADEFFAENDEVLTLDSSV